MNWKEQPTWLKGMIIGSGSIILLYLIMIIFGGIHPGIELSVGFLLYLLSGTIFKIYTGDNSSFGLLTGGVGDIILFEALILIISYALIGALVGWIIQKIKSKK